MLLLVLMEINLLTSAAGNADLQCIGNGNLHLLSLSH